MQRYLMHLKDNHPNDVLDVWSIVDDDDDDFME